MQTLVLDMTLPCPANNVHQGYGTNIPMIYKQKFIHPMSIQTNPIVSL